MPPPAIDLTADSPDLVEDEIAHHKVLTWTDGAGLALVMMGGLFSTVGYSIGAIGAWASMFLWGVSASIAILQNQIFSEMAAMFPKKSGGISMYAHEGWRRYFTPATALGTFGYWAGWSFVMSITGELVGTLVQAQWFSHTTWHITVINNKVGLAQVIALVTIICSWLLNIFGIKVAAVINKVVNSGLLAVLAIVAFGCFVDGKWHASNLSWHVGDWKVAIVWLYVIGWTIYGTEICATFAPEFRDTVRDTRRSIMSVSILLLAVYVIFPLGMAGSLGEKTFTANPVSYSVNAWNQVFGSAGSIATIIIVASSLLTMVAASADASRSLRAASISGLSLKQLANLSKRGVPSRALTLDAFVNVVLVILVASPLQILLASNLGYFTCIVLALAAFLLLRKDQPGLHRPIRLGPIWKGIAFVLLAANLFMMAMGLTHPALAGYGTTKDTLIGLGILAVSLVLFFYRRLVQDRGPMVWQDRTPVHLGDLDVIPESLALAGEPS
jgi:amino acid transporter